MIEDKEWLDAALFEAAGKTKRTILIASFTAALQDGIEGGKGRLLVHPELFSDACARAPDEYKTTSMLSYTLNGSKSPLAKAARAFEAAVAEHEPAVMKAIATALDQNAGNLERYAKSSDGYAEAASKKAGGAERAESYIAEAFARRKDAEECRQLAARFVAFVAGGELDPEAEAARAAAAARALEARNLAEAETRRKVAEAAKRAQEAADARDKAAREKARLEAAAPALLASLAPETLEAIANEIDSFGNSARAHSLRTIAKEQREAIKQATGE